MPKRLENALPKPRKLRNSLVAYADGKRVVFGNYDDAATWKKFSDFCEERKNKGTQTPAQPSLTDPPTSDQPPNRASCVPTNRNGNTPILVGELITQFLEAAQKTRNQIDFGNYKIVGKVLWRYREVTTADFDAFLLLQIQEGFVAYGYARRYCNKLTNYIIHIFKWGEVRRLVPPGKSGQLKVIEPVRIGSAKDNEERMPVDDDVVERTLPYLLPVYQAFIRIVRATGARPSEICRMKVSDVDRTDPKIWVYRLRHHKTMRYNKRRVLAFGMKEQVALLPYLDKKDHEAVFSPKDAVAELKEKRRDARKTPLTPSQKERDKNAKRNPNPRIKEHLIGHFKKSATQHLKYIPRNRLGLFDIAWSFVCVNSFNSSFVFA